MKLENKEAVVCSYWKEQESIDGALFEYCFASKRKVICAGDPSQCENGKYKGKTCLTK